MLIDFFIPFIAILLAELGDKTQLAVLTLATKHKQHFGKGFQDIIFVEDPKSPIIIEIKVLSKDVKKYEEGKFQLKDYVNKNSCNDGYYIIFQNSNYYNDDSFDEDGIKINQITINIAPEAPTTSFRENKTS